MRPRFPHRPPRPQPGGDHAPEAIAEPGGVGDRHTGMLTVKVNQRGAAWAVALAVSLTLGAVACGSGTSDAADGAPSSTTGPVTPSGDTTTAPPTTTEPTTATPTTGGPTTGGTTSGTGSIASRVVYFSSSVRAVAGTHEVLRDRDELDRFATTAAHNDGKTAAEISAGGAATDFGRYVLVGWTESTGCSAATSATLGVAGNSLKLRVEQPTPTAECLTDFRVTVVFEVPKDRIPARPAFG
ncbi:hypothetical protein ACIO6U_05395 [Streptomyces sp. NPDC087422]|uniref:hypothetical protein n=1 Tax=Streptomyces sp. NPDC087422 TaxID=3365786 RepID=UPI0037F74D69